VLDGVLLFERAGQLFAGSFDAMRDGTSGVPQPVLPDAESGQLSIAADGTATYIFQPEGGRRLVRVDRGGTVSPILEAPGAYRWLRFSPNGDRIALGIRRQAQSNGVYTDNYEIWGIDVASQRRWRLPDPAADATEPVWTPDGRSIIHTSRGADGYQITRQAADGSDEPEVLLDPDFDAWTTDISPDGRHLLFYGGLANTDIWVLPLDGSGEARVAIGGRGDERGGRFSPDGRYIAYGASEGGREDVFVQPFPELDQRWTISREGGRDPVWARDGSEIFFRRGTVVLGAKVQLQPEFSADAETVLFESQLWVDPWGDQSYDVLPDGQHLAMYELVPGNQPRLRVFTGLKKLLRDLR
jgi:Tol biopolymer transport system component